ncbi:hypothetical protein MBRA_06264 [Methylobacterium brachiatum]|nr:hypothetical protein MBRA_06264 [Methylobacterium brachiatum]
MNVELRSQDREIAIKRRWYAVGRDLYALPDDEIDRAYEVAKASGVALDDALAITMFVGSRIGRTVEDLVRVSSALPPLLEETARNAASAIRAAATAATGQVVESAVAQVEARHAEMSEAVGVQIADVARQVMQQQITAGRTRRASLLATAVCGSSLLALAIGYQIGVGHQAAVANTMAAYAARSDAASWMRLIAANPDLDRNLSAYCTPRSPAFQRLQNGTPTCSLPLYLDAPPLPGTIADGTGFIGRLDASFERLPWYTTVLIGALLLAGWQWSRKPDKRRTAGL